MITDIQIPPEVRAKYLERRRKDLADCKQALVTQDYACFEKVGHQIKGNAITFGFDALTSVGVDMESSAKNKDLYALKNLVQRFENTLNQLN